jgi:hypothetical protein
MRRKPERRTVFLTIFGVIELIFHFIIFCNGNGSGSTRFNMINKEKYENDIHTSLIFRTKSNSWWNIFE